VNAIGVTGPGQRSIAMQRQKGTMAPRDRAQRSCEHDLIRFW
jgi:hypothetical protein